MPPKDLPWEGVDLDHYIEVVWEIERIAENDFVMGTAARSLSNAAFVLRCILEKERNGGP